ncbi:10963_t:CDS:2, partial [Ambispora gerdemannii]
MLSCLNPLKKAIDDKVAWRKTEPTIIKVIKEIFLWLVYLGLFGYLVTLFIKLVNDKPLQIITSDYKSEIKPPRILFFGPFEFEVDCTFYVTYGNEAGSNSNCSTNLFVDKYNLESNEYMYTVEFYTNDDNVNFSNNGLSLIEFKLLLTNSSKSSIKSDEYLCADLFDHDSKLGVDEKNITNYALFEQLYKQNEYFLSPHQ